VPERQFVDKYSGESTEVKRSGEKALLLKHQRLRSYCFIGQDDVEVNVTVSRRWDFRVMIVMRSCVVTGFIAQSLAFHVGA
jgi:hypothetical protein